MARNGDVTLNDLRVQLAQHEAIVAKLRHAITAWEEIGAHGNGVHPRARRARLREKAVAAHPTGRATGRHRIRDAIMGLVTANPGVPVPEAIRQLEHMKLTDYSDPRKILSTRIGQLVRGKVLRREDNKLYVAE